MKSPSPAVPSRAVRGLVLVGCASLWIFAEVSRSHRSPASSAAPRGPTLGAVSTASDDADRSRPRGPRPESRRVRDLNQSLREELARINDPAGNAVLAAVTNALPPGWDRGFVLHDCLLAVVALSDLARLESTTVFGQTGVDPNGPHPSETLSPEARAFHEFTAELLARWLARKHPALGEETIRAILREHTLALDPALGPYDLIPIDDSIHALEIPEPRPETPTNIEIPDMLRSRYGPLPKKP